jgi:putative transposase
LEFHSNSENSSGNEMASVQPYSINELADLYFCTDTIMGWQNVFGSTESFEIIINSWKYCRTEKGLRVHGFVIMPNHVHSILSAATHNLSDIIRDFKRFTPSKLSEYLEGTGNQRQLNYFSSSARTAAKGNLFKIWQSGSHPEAITTKGFFFQKLNYIHNNPVRKGYVDFPEHWRYSSARNYVLNDPSVLAVDLVD